MIAALIVGSGVSLVVILDITVRTMIWVGEKDLVLDVHTATIVLGIKAVNTMKNVIKLLLALLGDTAKARGLKLKVNVQHAQRGHTQQKKERTLPQRVSAV